MAKLSETPFLALYVKGGINIPEWMQNARKGPSVARIGVIVKNRGRFFAVRKRFSAIFAALTATVLLFIYSNSFYALYFILTWRGDGAEGLLDKSCIELKMAVFALQYTDHC